LLKESGEERLIAVIATNAEPMASGVRPEEEQKGMKSREELAQMSLESLLYYVLVGEGRKRTEAAEG
jgi:hypothetical protein